MLSSLGFSLISNELELKRELVKWKERAMRWRDRSLREHTRVTVPRSPKKAVPSPLKEKVLTPSEDAASQETVAQGLPKPLSQDYTKFFDNSSLGIPAGM